MKYELINWKAIFIFLLIVTFSLFFFFPFYFMVSSSFKQPLDSSIYPPLIISFKPTLKNYITIFTKYPMTTYFINSFIVATFATLISMVLAIPASYGMERLISKNRERIAYMFLTMQLIPPISMVFALFWYANFFGILGTYWILVIGYTLWNVPYAIWLTRGFFSTIPIELEEAAFVDGASRLWVLRKIVLPLVKPGIIAATIFIFIGAWNEFTLAMFLTDSHTRTFPTTLGLFVTHTGILWGAMFATATLGVLPIVIIALLIRKHFVTALTLGAVKG
jgi:multiple sugar transport system permease protein